MEKKDLKHISFKIRQATDRLETLADNMYDGMDRQTLYRETAIIRTLAENLED